ncbi:acyl-carrier protein, probably mitochondrial [Volvox carteri f. nagariensis]|uniref:Acyl carrier protein n=1 Tax=Volvox carteri f. nagariensis TaxID=3068 RepID=D8U1A8_VOLCA|nr:acyl-carrier protein, probably mitochondrial [Volvox carteri f. nagariensis]EFJ46603.1 acyl-carrier protein, probably mitochondrial [Volvox carteri f. nagariensis]|eukprot:XP_002952460.1 acyl-carrier protein, probably mitochondrial [Volvox carteri f. nagariensis]
MALSSAVSMIRSTVLKHLRVTVTCNAHQSALPTFTNIISRGFGGGFLDKDGVTERVLHVTKHFEKIDASKVTPSAHFEKDLGLDSLDVVELVMALEEESAWKS